jgi:hypothetical protein
MCGFAALSQQTALIITIFNFLEIRETILTCSGHVPFISVFRVCCLWTTDDPGSNANS